MTGATVNEPEVVVTEEDRRLARDAIYGDGRAENWVIEGTSLTVPLSMAKAARVAQAIARARTMARFEERVDNVIKCLETARILRAASKVCGVDLKDVDLEDVSIARIRALVLRGWGGGS